MFSSEFEIAGEGEGGRGEVEDSLLTNFNEIINPNVLLRKYKTIIWLYTRLEPMEDILLLSAHICIPTKLRND